MYQQPTSMNGMLLSAQYGALEPHALAFDTASNVENGRGINASHSSSRHTFARPVRSSSRSSSSTTTSSVFSQPTASSTCSSPKFVHSKADQAKSPPGSYHELSPASAMSLPTLRQYVSGCPNGSTSGQTVVTARLIEDSAVILENWNNHINQSVLWSFLMENMSINEGNFEVQHAKSSKGRIQLVLRFETSTLAKQAIQSLSYATFSGSAIRVVAGCIPCSGQEKETSEQGQGTKGGPVICDGSVIE